MDLRAPARPTEGYGDVPKRDTLPVFNYTTLNRLDNEGKKVNLGFPPLAECASACEDKDGCLLALAKKTRKIRLTEELFRVK